MLRKIKITQALIDEAAPYAIQTIFEKGIVIGTGPWSFEQANKLSQNCPIARSLNSAFPGEHFHVTYKNLPQKALIEAISNECQKLRFDLPIDITAKVRNYDKGLGMEPFEFEVEVPE